MTNIGHAIISVWAFTYLNHFPKGKVNHDCQDVDLISGCCMNFTTVEGSVMGNWVDVEVLSLTSTCPSIETYTGFVCFSILFRHLIKLILRTG